MTYITSTQVVGGSLAVYHDLLAALPTTEPLGLLARYAGTTDGMLVITAVWESKAHSDRFTAEMLRPAIRGLSLPPGQSSRTVEYETDDEFVAVPSHGPAVEAQAD
ncbi:MAG: hypothetical protein ACLGI2_10470 [Acidimicrobiia bacterium]